MAENKQNAVLLVDFLNLVRSRISDKSADAKFETLDELISSTMEIAKLIYSISEKEQINFEKIYLVTKSFKFSNEILYNDIPKIIIWSFCTAVPQWKNKVCLVLVNGINQKDRAADDRTLFILYNEFLKTIPELKIMILSNDHFNDIGSQFLRQVTLSFYWAGYMTEDWKTSETLYQFHGQFQQQKNNDHNTYLVFHPKSNEQNFIEVGS